MSHVESEEQRRANRHWHAQRTSDSLGVDAHEVQVLPDLLDEIVEVERHLATDDDRVRTASELIDLLDRAAIDLVVGLQIQRAGRKRRIYE